MEHPLFWYPLENLLVTLDSFCRNLGEVVVERDAFQDSDNLRSGMELVAEGYIDPFHPCRCCVP